MLCVEVNEEAKSPVIVEMICCLGTKAVPKFSIVTQRVTHVILLLTQVFEK